jgi:uncharacterized protein (DUF2236 family)
MLVGAALMGAAANVIMQLARPGVGYGVVESKVESGQAFRHPVKRTRTTVTYLAVAMLGTDEERQQYRTWVNKSHVQVHSNENSPVRYNAFDPRLQLWVAACLYRGVEDTWRLFFGTPELAVVEAQYARAAALGTTLQVSEDMWPADREMFEKYWHDALDEVHIDDTVRRYLDDLTMLRFLPAVLRVPFALPHKFITVGFLPPRFREEMRYSWSPRSQRWFERITKVVGAVAARLPRPLREFPFNVYLWDLRRRIKRGTPLV